MDEFGAGCPIAYCLSTHTDTRSKQVFFEQIKKYAGSIKTKVFMPDDCDNYYSAWSVVMGHSEHRLLCTWHGDRAWRRNLCAKVNGNAMLKSTVYKALKTLHLQIERSYQSRWMACYFQKTEKDKCWGLWNTDRNKKEKQYSMKCFLRHKNHKYCILNLH
ncbi:uncharacterized protein LOC124551365 [Schistocerca americana]|uniref:uncharacterized protein LOC124551365 n=1 Tax=Schistocerca americana TaxID=7009 RepID=UPI001F5008C2|nr:uncharacterized protein LOC124551365 [Schistocerca americana]